MIIEEDLRGIEENCYSSPAHKLASILARGADKVVITVEEHVIPLEVVEMAAETEDYVVDIVESPEPGILKITLRRT